MSDLLLEIGTEEIPAGYIEPALRAFAKKMKAQLKDARIAHVEIETFATPRRLTLLIRGLATQQEDLDREENGPPKSVAFDKDGNPTKAAIGFAKKNGVEVADLRTIETAKGEYLVASVHEMGRPTAEVLGEIVPVIVAGLPFPKTQRWESTGFLFARPIRWIVALLDQTVVPITIADVTSGRVSRGHRILSPGAIPIAGPDTYEDDLMAAHVVVSPAARRVLIEAAIDAVAQEREVRIIPDDALLEEVTYLVEYPHAILGSFDKRFLALPDRIVTTAMRSHQRYFAVQDETGTLQPHFVTIANGTAANEKSVRAGNERVLTARLADASFYWDEDRATPPADRVAMLERIVWQKGMGSLLDKTERVRTIAEAIAREVAPETQETVSRAAHIAKTDLTTEMIKDGKEFTKLQGYMGMEYARAAGETEAVALAIYEQYMPRFSGDDLPSSVPGAILSLADRVDTMLAAVSLGNMPTGSQDPYALRRHARGILRLLGEGGVDLEVGRLIDLGVEVLGARIEDPAKVKSDTMEFVRGRLENMLGEKGYAYDVVSAVVSLNMDDPADVEERVLAIRDFRETDDFQNLVHGYKRVVNILKKAEGVAGVPDPALFKDDEERALHEAVEAARPHYEAALADRNYRKAMERLITLRGPIDQFFDKVLVMDKDEAIRNNRFALLSGIAQLFGNLADLSKVVLEGEN